MAFLVCLLVACLAASTSASCCAGMTMNALGIELTESSEGYVDHVYNDAAGNPTVCYGHLVTPGETFPPVVSQAECTQLLQQDLGSAESCVQNSVNVPLNSNQFSALVDFTFNLGCGSLQSSTLLRILNQNDYSGVPAQMMRWTYAGGQQLPGLVTRRQNEGTLWNTPVSGGGSTAPMTTPVATTQPGTAGPASSSAVALGTSQVGSAAPTTNPAAQGSTASAALFAEVAGSSESSTSSSMPVYAVVAIAVGCVGLVLAVAGVVLRARAARRAEELEQSLLAPTSAEDI